MKLRKILKTLEKVHNAKPTDQYYPEFALI